MNFEAKANSDSPQPCPNCGVTECGHSPEQMQFFAVEAMLEATEYFDTLEMGDRLIRPMTLDEAIDHAREVMETCDDGPCSFEHSQIVGWLTELKNRRAQEEPHKDLFEFYDVENIGELVGEMETQIARLQEKLAEKRPYEQPVQWVRGG